MKCLWIVSFAAALVATAFTGHHAHAAEYCPSGQLMNSINITLDDIAGTAHSIKAGCVTSEDIDIVIDATPFVPKSSPASTVTIGPNVYIGRRNLIAIRGAKAANSDAHAHFVVSIFDSQFGNDAAIYVDGDLPEGTLINIYGNRFNASEPLFGRIPNSNPNKVFAACIIINDLKLISAKMAISNNNIYGTDVQHGFYIQGITIETNLYFMGDGASFVVSGNNITSICNPVATGGICSYGVAITSVYAYTYGSLNIDDNRFFTAGGLAVSMPTFINPMGSANMSFSRNSGQLNTMYLPHNVQYAEPCLEINSINMQNRSNVAILNNEFDVHGTGAMITLAGDCIMSENSTMRISGNIIRSVECDPGIYFTEHSTSGDSQIFIENNSLQRDDDTPVTRAMVYMGGTLGLKDRSKLTIASNNWGGREPSTELTALLLDLSPSAAGNNFIFDKTASLYMCNNVVDGTAITSTNAVKLKINGALQTRVMAAGCSAPPATTNAPRTTTRATTTTTTTTAAPTTTAAGGGAATQNGSSTASIAVAILAVAMCAVVAAMTSAM